MFRMKGKNRNLEKKKNRMFVVVFVVAEIFPATTVNETHCSLFFIKNMHPPPTFAPLHNFTLASQWSFSLPFHRLHDRGVNGPQTCIMCQDCSSKRKKNFDCSHSSQPLNKYCNDFKCCFLTSFV